MLVELLKFIKQGGAFSLPALARHFNVSEALVEQMLADLVRLGYLRAVESCGKPACDGCPQGAACSTHRLAQTWVYEKGTK